MKLTRISATVLILVLGMVGGESAKADLIFGDPVNLGPVVNSAHDEYTIDVSSDGLTLVFSGGPYSWQPGGKGGDDIWMATRETTDEPFAAPVNLTGINTSRHEFSPTLSADQLSIFFSSDRPGGRGNFDLWVATRPSKSAPFANPVNLGSPVNSSSPDFSPCLPADGLSLYFNSSRSGGSGQCDLHVTTRATINSPWSTPQNLGPRINSYRPDGLPRISDDGLTLFYATSKPGGYGYDDLYVVTRASTSEAWGTPLNLGPTINTSSAEPSISIWEDRSVMFFASARPGGTGGIDIWQAPIIPVVDFNGDGIVNLKDFSKLALYWRQNESSVDIAPATLGDGKVDIRDMVVLGEHWLTGFFALAHWKLDEQEGLVAYDSAGNKDGTLHGDPNWRPIGGMVDGALELDGIDDYVSTDFVLNPADGAFSVFTWVKGGTPGEVLISQTDGTGVGKSWLCADSLAGRLVTELKAPGRGTLPLTSEFVITDGDWHYIGLVWDGLYRYLYVGETQVAKDPMPLSPLESADGGLYFGAGKTLDAATFFSGLIDDIRIYNQAVTPYL
ncbi:MAG: PD40 domain-containing protein [Planctomycetes bacterium]|nr:PD40 domain-containing protein [Planctomycetota bacterium]